MIVLFGGLAGTAVASVQKFKEIEHARLKRAKWAEQAAHVESTNQVHSKPANP